MEISKFEEKKSKIDFNPAANQKTSENLLKGFANEPCFF